MQRSLLAVAIGLLVLPLIACDAMVQRLSLEIRDFDSSQVLGVSLWHLDPATGEYAKVQDIPFERTTIEGTEWVSYPIRLPGAGAEQEVTWLSRVARGEVATDTVTLELLLARPLPGTYKISTSNAAGESTLSVGTLVLDSAV